MMQKSGNTKQNNDADLPPSEIPIEDWENSPISVRALFSTISKVKTEDLENAPFSVQKYLTTLFEAKKTYKNRYPLITILINLGVIILFTYILEGIISPPCISPHIIGPLSLSIFILIFLHLALRPLVQNASSQNVDIQIGKYKISLSIITAFLYEMQFWKLRNSLLVLLLLVSFAAGVFFNLSPYSPFYTPDDISAIQYFIIQRFHKESKEGLTPGETLKLTVNENVFIKAVFRGESERKCVWYSRMSNPTSHLGCSIVLDDVSNPGRDTLTVLIQSACGTQNFSGLHVEVQP